MTRELAWQRNVPDSQAPKGARDKRHTVYERFRFAGAP